MAIEQLEAGLGEGPCSHSLATGQLIPVPDLEAARETYPRFVPRALEIGVRSVYAVPMSHRSQQVGALNLISRAPVVLSHEEVAVAQMLADVTMSYIANSRMLQETTTLSAHLRQALDSRVVIEQAKGTLAERRGIGLSEAFERMRAHSRSNSRKIHDVARDVLTGTLDL
ncbi:hypothetical protein BH23ACT9_BH23ACT9_03620 [soil metagenome]